MLPNVELQKGINKQLTLSKIKSKIPSYFLAYEGEEGREKSTWYLIPLQATIYVEIEICLWSLMK